MHSEWTPPAIPTAPSGTSTKQPASTEFVNQGSTLGLQTIWVPATAMGLTTTPPARGTITISVMLFDVLDFDQTTQEEAMFTIAMPKSWDKGNLFFQPYWTASGGTGNFRLVIGSYAVSDGDALNQGSSLQVVVDDTLIAANDLQIGPLSSGFTPAGSPANDDMLYFLLQRDTTDTLNADARLLGIKLLYTVNAGNDS